MTSSGNMRTVKIHHRLSCLCIIFTILVPPYAFAQFNASNQYDSSSKSTSNQTTSRYSDLQPQQINAKQDLNLPDLGDASSSTFSLEKEYQLGRAWLKAFRSSIETVNDPLLQNYIEELTYQLAVHSELKDRRLDIVVVNNKSINAFAVPGGVIGVHNGLLLQAETEAQLASVLSHELAHLSQRHFARSVEAAKRNTILNLAGLLAGVILAATAGGDAGLAVITATQAASLQSQLRYSRLHEQEADREGMQTMARANMDPHAAAGMFEQMQQAVRYAGNRPPEFLLTHPVTESRISDTRNRARQYPRKMYTDNLRFQLMQARIDFAFASSSLDAEKIFRARLASKTENTEAQQYGLVLALLANRKFNEASELLTILRKGNKKEISYLIAEADLAVAQNNHQQAIQLLSDFLDVSPNNHPATMSLANAFLKNNQPHKAEAILKKHVQIRENDPYIWYLLAETHGLAGNIVGVHQARAEYFVLNGALERATKQLGYALPLLKSDHLTSIKIKARIRQIQQEKAMIKAL